MAAKRELKGKLSRSKELNIRYTFSTGQLNLFALSVLALAQQQSPDIFSTIFL